MTDAAELTIAHPDFDDLNDAQLRAFNLSCEAEILRYMNSLVHTRKRTQRAFDLIDVMEASAREIARRNRPCGPQAVSYEIVCGARFRFCSTVLAF